MRRLQWRLSSTRLVITIVAGDLAAGGCHVSSTETGKSASGYGCFIRASGMRPPSTISKYGERMAIAVFAGAEGTSYTGTA